METERSRSRSRDNKREKSMSPRRSPSRSSSRRRSPSVSPQRSVRSNLSSDMSEGSGNFDHHCYNLEEIDTHGGSRPLPIGCDNKDLRHKRMQYLTREEAKMKFQAAQDKRNMRIDKVAYEKHCDLNNEHNTLPLAEWIEQYGKFKPYKFGENPRWREEKKIKPCALDDQDRKVGHGSFYKRSYNDYTTEEMLARQGRSLRVRTKDLIPFDRIKREVAGDDSDKESDWLDRTGHAKGHISSLGDMAANRALLNDKKGGWLPAAYAVDESKRTELQKLSFDIQNKACTAAANKKAQEKAQEKTDEKADEKANEEESKMNE